MMMPPPRRAGSRHRGAADAPERCGQQRGGGQRQLGQLQVQQSLHHPALQGGKEEAFLQKGTLSLISHCLSLLIGGVGVRKEGVNIY